MLCSYIFGVDPTTKRLGKQYDDPFAWKCLVKYFVEPASTKKLRQRSLYMCLLLPLLPMPPECVWSAAFSSRTPNWRMLRHTVWTTHQPHEWCALRCILCIVLWLWKYCASSASNRCIQGRQGFVKILLSVILSWSNLRCLMGSRYSTAKANLFRSLSVLICICFDLSCLDGLCAFGFCFRLQSRGHFTVNVSAALWDVCHAMAPRLLLWPLEWKPPLLQPCRLRSPDELTAIPCHTAIKTILMQSHADILSLFLRYSMLLQTFQNIAATQLELEWSHIWRPSSSPQLPFESFPTLASSWHGRQLQNRRVLTQYRLAANLNTCQVHSTSICCRPLTFTTSTFRSTNRCRLNKSDGHWPAFRHPRSSPSPPKVSQAQHHKFPEHQRASEHLRSIFCLHICLRTL